MRGLCSGCAGGGHRERSGARTTRRLLACGHIEQPSRLGLSAHRACPGSRRSHEPIDAERAETRALSQALRSCFATLTLAAGAGEVVIVAERRAVADMRGVPRSVEARFDLREWMRRSRRAQASHRLYGDWEADEILAGLRSWAALNGRSPRSSDWASGSLSRPTSLTVRRHFRSWRRALLCAGLPPGKAPPWRLWDEEGVINALCAWTVHHGRPPTPGEWLRTGPGRPYRATVYARFGTWDKALAAAAMLQSAVGLDAKL
jgi:Homing endonuclease associated repeat